jgi:hypothetical protein
MATPVALSKRTSRSQTKSAGQIVSNQRSKIEIDNRSQRPSIPGEKTMTTATAIPAVESLTLNITQEIHVRASLEITFEALLEQLGPENSTPEKPMPMKLEAWPGGRWYRDLGDNNGHFWGHVQAIKRPTLLEFTGPLFMSYGGVSNLQYRLSEEKDGTLIKFHHSAIAIMPEEHRQNVNKGWSQIHNRVRERAEAKAQK